MNNNVKSIVTIFIIIVVAAFAVILNDHFDRDLAATRDTAVSHVAK